MASTIKNSKPLPRTSDRHLIIMLLQFIGKHISYSSKGDIAESEWQAIQKAVQSTTAYELLKGFLAYSNLPWRVVWKEDGGFDSQITLFLNELQVDILEAMGWAIKHEGDHRAVIGDGVMLSSEAISGNLNQNDIQDATVDFTGKPFRLERYEYRDGWLVTFTLANIPQSTEASENLGNDDLDIEYDDRFIPSVEEML